MNRQPISLRIVIRLIFLFIVLLLENCNSTSEWSSSVSQFEINNGTIDHLVSIQEKISGEDACYPVPNCNSSDKFRTYDGTCNNLNNPTWGSNRTVYIRFLPADYNDGVQEIRKSKDGKELPNLRKISTTLFSTKNRESDEISTMALVMWGQLLTHDSASSAFKYLNCCPNGHFPSKPIDECYQLSISKDDPFYSKYGVTCMGYTRIITTAEANCSLKPQQQISEYSQWLDLSMIYQASESKALSLRELSGGKLKVELINDQALLPRNHEPFDFCRITNNNESCFKGDSRLNQNPSLIVMTVIFAREHNKLAGELKKLNPQWDDERLFQEARRINIAQSQHITYSEYLPHILDSKYSGGMKLGSLKSGYTSYQPEVRGGTLNEVTGGVFRTFHSTLQGDIKLVGGGSGSCPMKRAKLGDYWWTGGNLVIPCFQQIAKGLYAQKADTYGADFTDQSMNFYQKGGKPYGDDLEVVDMMRGRDLGLPPYTKLRSTLGFSPIKSFNDLLTIMIPQDVTKLKQLYSNVEDIDLYVGALLEKPVSKGLTGPTTQVALAQQFARWKFGDRFYYEHKEQAGSFSPEQLEQIRKVSFSSMMCRNINIDKIQKHGFSQQTMENDIVSCQQIPEINLTVWKE